MKTIQIKKNLLMALKVALGSSLAIYVAQCLNLNHATSAGTITLLTIMTTKWETVRLSLSRLITFILTAFAAWVAFMHIDIVWISYGVFIFMVVFVSALVGLKATISVNSVVGAHLLITHDFSLVSIENELILVLIGIGIALILNLFQDNRNHKKQIVGNIQYTEEKLQTILVELSDYLLKKKLPVNVWNEISVLEKKILVFQQEAFEYQENTFCFHPEYYINYFEMRQNQTQMLHNLHYEIKRMRDMPSQAKIVAEYMLYLKDYVKEKNVPTQQMDRLKEIFDQLRLENLPKTREEFENRALLYHVLMDIEEFLVFKNRFIRSLDEVQIKEYWK